MTLEEIYKAIVDYESEAYEIFWDDNPDIANRANETKFFEWLKKNKPKDFEFILNELKKYRLRGGNRILTIGISHNIEPIEERMLKSQLDLFSIFSELCIEFDPVVYDEYKDRYKCLDSAKYNLDEELKRDLIAVMFCEYLAETSHPLGQEIIDTKYGVSKTASMDAFEELEYCIELGDEESVEFIIEELESNSLSIADLLQLNAYKTTYKKRLEKFDEETKRYVEAIRKYPNVDVYEIPDISDFIKKANSEKLLAYLNNAMRKGY